MIKLGNDYFDPSAIEAIVRSKGDDSFVFLLASKLSVAIHISKDELEAALISAGLLEKPEAEPLATILTQEQYDELLRLNHLGYEFVAKDKDGRSYAFWDLPEKHGAYWESNEAHQAARLTEDYDMLDWEDDKPTSIAWLLGSEAQDGN